MRDCESRPAPRQTCRPHSGRPVHRLLRKQFVLVHQLQPCEGIVSLQKVHSGFQQIAVQCRVRRDLLNAPPHQRRRPLPAASGRLYSADAVSRHWLPGSSASGCSSRPMLYCTAQLRVGATNARPDHESSAASWMLHRSSFGSRPLNAEPSSFTRSITNPVVTTPKLVCVESCKWWPSGANGNSEAEARCRYVTGPSAGSADGPP